MVEHLDQDSLEKEGVIVSHGSRGMRVHPGGGAWQPGAGMVAGTRGRAHISTTGMKWESKLELMMLSNLQSRPQWRTSSSKAVSPKPPQTAPPTGDEAYGGRVSLKPPQEPCYQQDPKQQWAVASTLVCVFQPLCWQVTLQMRTTDKLRNLCDFTQRISRGAWIYSRRLQNPRSGRLCCHRPPPPAAMPEFHIAAYDSQNISSLVVSTLHNNCLSFCPKEIDPKKNKVTQVT